MPSAVRFIVSLERPRFGRASRLMVVGRFIPRRSGAHGIWPSHDLSLHIFSEIHHLASHSPRGGRWHVAEKRLTRRYLPNLWRMVVSGIKKERL